MTIRSLLAVVLSATLFLFSLVSPLNSATSRPTVSPKLTEEQAKREANENVVTIIGSGRQTAFTQFAEDISNVLEGVKGNDLRILPVLGHSENKNVLDMLYLKGVDMAIVDREVLVNLKKTDPARYNDLEKRIYFIAKLFNTALHIYGRNDIKSLEDLRGKKVSCLKEGSTIDVMCRTVFKLQKIDVQIVYDDFDAALQKVKTGEVAAAATGGPTPVPGFERVKPEDGLHFIPIDSEALPNSNFKEVLSTYLPTVLKHEDYPNMIPEGKTISTVTTTSLLAVYAWPPGTARYERLRRFVSLFFNNLNAFQNDARHPRWRQVNFATDVKGWTRFNPAQEWLDKERKAMVKNTPGDISNDAKMKMAFAKFLDQQTQSSAVPLTEAQKEDMFALFAKWWQTMKKQQTGNPR